MPKIKLVAPDGGPRILPDLSGTGVSDVIEHGGVIDVPAELAGEAPRWRRVGEPDEDTHHPAHDPSGFFDRREHAGHPEVYDLGTGLLAQVGVWEAVSRETAPTVKDAD
jgi:hypothetical protein